MTLRPDQLEALSAPLSSASVKTNPKGFDYIPGWHAIAEANRIFGFDGWDRQLTKLEQVAPHYEVNGNNRVAYRAVVRIIVFAGDRTITRDGTGYGSGIGKDLNDAHESAVKEAETDAMKRALMTFGNPFGLALYDKAKANVSDGPAEAAPDFTLAVTAAQTAITLANTRAELKRWMADNKAVVDTLPEAAADAVVRSFNERWAAVADDRKAA